MKTKNLIGAIAIALITFSACEKEEQNQAQAIASEEPCNCEEVEFYPLTGDEETVTKLFYGVETEFKAIDGGFVLGDMILSEEQIDETNDRTKGAITSNSSYVWPKSSNGYYYIPYRVALDLPNKDRVYDAIKHWEANTNLRFIHREKQTDYIRFVKGTGCSSWIGRQGGKQEIKLASGCTTGNTIHEIGHAIGLYHEHVKPDRDKYVTINWANIEDDKKHNFNLASGMNHYWGVDFNSIMIYGSYAFSKNGKATITKSDGTTFIGQRKKLSDTDIQIVNFKYD